MNHNADQSSGLGMDAEPSLAAPLRRRRRAPERENRDLERETGVCYDCAFTVTGRNERAEARAKTQDMRP